MHRVLEPGKTCVLTPFGMSEIGHISVSVMVQVLDTSPTTISSFSSKYIGELYTEGDEEAVTRSEV